MLTASDKDKPAKIDLKKDYRNNDGNKMTMILVGTKSDKVFQSGFQHDDDDDANKAQDAMFMENQKVDNIPV